MRIWPLKQTPGAMAQQSPTRRSAHTIPQGSKQRVTMVIDGVSISLGSTVYITAQPGRFLTINTLEGSVFITAAGHTETANPGKTVQVPLDNQLRASGPPVSGDFYSEDAIRALPLVVLPDTGLSFAPGLPPTLIFNYWSETGTMQSANCSFNGAKTEAFRIKVGYSPTTMWYGWTVLTKSVDGNYSGTTSSPATSGGVIIGQGTDNFAIKVDSADHLSGTITTSFPGGSICVDSIQLARVIYPGQGTLLPTPTS